jgi:hypothetical protein
MSSFPLRPRLIKGGIVLIDPENSTIKRIIPLQYNPETLSRTLQVQNMPEGGDKSDVLRLTGPPVETIKLDIEIDATDQLEVADSTSVQVGIQPHLAALELIIYPSSDQLLANNSLSRSGTLEIAPMVSFLTLFIWSKERVLPVSLTEFSITEEAFDANLNPIRAKISLGMRVLSVDDFGFDKKGGSLYMTYQQNKERLARMFKRSSLNTLGIETI